MGLQQGTLRNRILRTHLFVGLLSGIVALALGISGSILVFRPELERAAQPRTVESPAPSASIQNIVAGYSQAHPDQPVRSVILPQDERDPVQLAIASGERNRRVTVDATGGELPSAQPGWIAWLVRFHHTLFANGHILTGIAGLLLSYLCVSGIVIWWPAIRALRFDVTFDPSRLRSYRARDLHVFVGVWTMALLLLLAFSGTVFTWRDAYTRAALTLTGGRYEQIKPPRTGDARSLDLDAAIASARTAVPGATPTMLRLPGKPGEPITVRMRADSDLRRMGSNQVFIGDAGQVLGIDRLADKPFGVRAVDALAAIHMAEFGGLPLKLLWVVVGFAPAILFLSGFRLWWRKTVQSQSREGSLSHLTVVSPQPSRTSPGNE